jgi:hypothetical protein
MVLELIQKLSRITVELKSRNRFKQAENIDNVIEFLKSAYAMRFKKQRHGRGLTKLRRHQWYVKNKSKVKRRMKVYRKRYKNMLQRRRKRKHFRRT